MAMANLAKSDTLFAFTSPRTLEKTIPEIRLLTENFSGKIWVGNEDIQIQYFNLLFQSGFYEGETKPTDIPFAARDRITRSPKALGFVDLEPEIAITSVGRLLLENKRVDEIFTRQLMKFQLPSPYHVSGTSDRFYVKPYLELLRLAYDLDGLSKTEMAIFFLQLTHLSKYDAIKEKILRFRKEGKKTRINRRTFIEECFRRELKETFAGKLSRREYSTRESSTKSAKRFIATKKNNMRDYADAFMRYLRATQLVTFKQNELRLKVSDFKRGEVEFLLKTVEREPRQFTDQDSFKSYLFDPSNPKLLTDDKGYLLARIGKITDGTRFVKPSMTIEKLKEYLSTLEQKQRANNLEKTTQALKSYDEFPEILSVFEQIHHRELPDPSLYLEWNVWRALTMLNYAIKVHGNFSFDLDGAPLCTAQGNKPDIECEYDHFGLIVEVTLSSGCRQYEMEGEPVARHYGNIRKIFKEKPVFCLFLAPTINDAALAHFYNLNRMHTRVYGGKTKIIPMALPTFIKFMETGVRKQFTETEILKQFFDKAIEAIDNSQDEKVWFDFIDNMARQWI